MSAPTRTEIAIGAPRHRVPPTAGLRTATGAHAVVSTLEELGVTCVFGITRGAESPLHQPLLDSSSIRHVQVRHEQGAGHAASGYAQATGRVGVCIASSGPGALNLVTALADAHMDSVPVVAITGQVSRPLIGTDAFQEADIVGITMPITKHNILVTDPDQVCSAIAEAFHIAASGRPGVVLVDIPKDVLHAPAVFERQPPGRLAGYRTHPRPKRRSIEAAATLIGEATAPVLYVGGGVVRADAADELRALAELTDIPVVTTLMARGAFPDTHDLHLGMPGMHGTVAAVTALQRSDLIIALGARFDDRVTGQAHTFAPHARVIHADIDPAEIGKNRAVDIPIVGDCKEVIRALTEAITVARSHTGAADLTMWRRHVDEVRNLYPLSYADPLDGSLAPQFAIEAVGKAAGPDAIYVAGVGQHQMWAAHFIPFQNPRSWLNSGGMGTMGYAIPAALGAKLARPDKEVWAIDGDGCFQMTCRELTTAATEGVPIKVALINNGNLGMVKQLQAVHYAGRYSQVDLATQSRRIPDFVKLADALGCASLRCDRKEDVAEAIAAARSIDDRPVVIDFVVNDDTLVWPMVAAGTSNDHIMSASGVRPFFDDAE